VAQIAYTQGPIDIDGTAYGSIQSLNFDPAIQSLILSGAGLINPTFAGLQSGRPAVTFTTTAIDTFLALLGATGHAIATSVIVYFTQKVNEGVNAGATSHVKLTIGNGLVIPVSLTASQGDGSPGNAVLECQVFATSDGTNSPLTIAVSQSLPAIPVNNEVFSLAKLDYGGADWDIESATLNFGLDILQQGSNGIPWDQFVAVRTQQPTLEIITSDLDLLATLTNNGDSIDDVIQYFRRKTQRGTHDTDVTESHVKITIAEAFATAGAVSSDQGGEAKLPVTIQPIFDGTNAILVIDPNAAIA